MTTTQDKRLALANLLNQVDEAVDELDDPVLQMITITSRQFVMGRLEELAQDEAQAALHGTTAD